MFLQSASVASGDSLKVGVIQSTPYVNVSHQNNDKIKGLLCESSTKLSGQCSHTNVSRVCDRGVETCGRPQLSLRSREQCQRRDARSTTQRSGRVDRGIRSREFHSLPEYKRK